MHRIGVLYRQNKRYETSAQQEETKIKEAYEIADDIRNQDTWNDALCAELCEAADMTAGWEQRLADAMAEYKKQKEKK